MAKTVASSPKVGLAMITADPLHWGHILPPAFARKQFGLNQVRFVTGNNPWKYRSADGGSDSPNSGITDGEIRHQMVVAGTRGDPYFEPDRVELDRGAVKTFTIDTLRLLREQVGDDVEFNLIVGLDTVPKIIDWKEGEDVLRSVRLLVAPRDRVPGVRYVRRQLPSYAKFAIIECPVMTYSSTQIRQLIGIGEHRLAGYMMPAGARRIVVAHKLYRTTAA